ncbi:MAG: hypothetical protein KZQ77_06835 [Candidatus Thiodiazotropha sp. (ex Notomyrtea botanica)]|nr:hypothetical protein [Candidatus Thiodiazotropha sp. (ex Notomyrtea botanica)]
MSLMVAHICIFDAEDHCTQACKEYKGYLALSDSFKCVFLETVELINTECRPKITNQLSESYVLFVPRLVHGFQSLCGAEMLATKGYPYHAYTLLRNTFDTLVLVAAALQGITDFYSIEGIDPGEEFDPKASKRLRKDTEYEVRRQMTGSKSGLKQETIDELAQWDALFDAEVHGARLSLADTQGWMKGQAPLPVLPVFNERAFAMFMNRFCEIAWTICRLLPLVQPPEAPLNDTWKGKWQILDQSFASMVGSLTSELDKKIGAAIACFVGAKFPFNENSSFPL